jgi:hypothetical protein
MLYTLVLLRVRGIYVHGLFGLMCGKTMSRSRHTYLSNHRRLYAKDVAQTSPQTSLSHVRRLNCSNPYRRFADTASCDSVG